MGTEAELSPPWKLTQSRSTVLYRGSRHVNLRVVDLERLRLAMANSKRIALLQQFELQRVELQQRVQYVPEQRGRRFECRVV